MQRLEATLGRPLFLRRGTRLQLTAAGEQLVRHARQLVALGADVTADVLPQVGHELDPRLIERAIDQLRSFLPRRAWRAAMEAAPVQSTAASSKNLDR